MSDWSDEEEIEKFAQMLDEGCSTAKHYNDATTSQHMGVPEEFPFPFEPYSIQKQLMSKIYEAMEMEKIGIFESPTGTGKSLSIICSALKWLRDDETRRQLNVKQQLLVSEKTTCAKSSSKDPPWLAAFAAKQHAAKENAEEMKKKEALLEMESRLLKLRENIPSTEIDGRISKRKRDDNDDNAVSEEQGSASEDETFDQSLADEVHITKIYYCSRTHSQLAQFVNEVKDSPYGKSAKVVTLGSRQNMCVNPEINRLKSIHSINDKCVEMKKNSKKSTRNGDNSTSEKKSRKETCPYYSYTSMSKLSLLMLDSVKDIEDLMKTSQKVKACPYYASRHSIPASEIVVLPYNTLLHSSTRKASGIKLKGNIVIIDEAHNLLDTISQIHSVQVSQDQFILASSQLIQYKERYKSRLSAKNLLHVNQLIRILNRINSHFNDLSSNTDSNGSQAATVVTELHTVHEYLEKMDLDNINFFELLQYCSDSHISRTLRGFTSNPSPEVNPEVKSVNLPIRNLLNRIQGQESSIPTDAQNDQASTSLPVPLSSPMYVIEGLLQAMTNSYSDGRIIISKQGDPAKSSLRYLLLNPALYFSEIIKQARSVIIIGGTMQPVEEFKQQLFYTGDVDKNRIMEFSCGHVIPADQLLPIALSTGLDGKPLNFTYNARAEKQTLDSLGSVLIAACKSVPAGVVCFLPSYGYESIVMNHLEKNGMLKIISEHKKVFREPKRASMVDSVLTSYTACITKCKKNSNVTLTGAILFSVVGGKMSEGINFSDDLGRCVIMVGLPYPNSSSPELKEKLAYLNSTMPVGENGVKPGQIHYENLCMKAVNQSIGRAIRHKNDYASMLLLDERYHRDSIIHKLPGWLNPHVLKSGSVNEAMKSIEQFFRTRSGS